jgi:hypothetical protein
VHDLSRHDGQRGFIIKALQQLPALRVPEDKAVMLMVVAMDSDPDIMEAGGKDHDHLGIVRLHIMVLDHAWLYAAFHQQA